MSKRSSGKPRHPRSPVAKAVRTPAFKMQVVPDKRWPSKVKQAEKNGVAEEEAINKTKTKTETKTKTATGSESERAG